MELVGKISKGTRMDQIYIPKNRAGFNGGEYVLILPLSSQNIKKEKFKLFFYGISNLEKIKLRLIEEIFNLIGKNADFENIIITGSFLERGFCFNDIDILLVSGKKGDYENIKGKIEDNFGIKAHFLILNNKELASGLSSEPLYEMMLSKCISLKRISLNVKRKINYKILDLALLKSKTLIDNFKILNGNEKYYLVLNMISILLFVQGRKLSKEIINREIEKLFSIKISEIKNNFVDIKFLKRYKQIYNKTFNKIMENIK